MWSESSECDSTTDIGQLVQLWGSKRGRASKCVNPIVKQRSGVTLGVDAASHSDLVILLYMNHVTSDVSCNFKLFANDLKLCIQINHSTVNEALRGFKYTQLNQLPLEHTSWGACHGVLTSLKHTCHSCHLPCDKHPSRGEFCHVHSYTASCGAASAPACLSASCLCLSARRCLAPTVFRVLGHQVFVRHLPLPGPSADCLFPPAVWPPHYLCYGGTTGQNKTLHS
ncbi:hypothetical protein E2C01_009430 [Portunus trituberculatus]|uniref:Uncharacterized protein n=1 Tax=Portunus trituberculatus TaxID=210409 RepID=A0A5B7D4Z1_PORTR|nr:hypothetical protein [Portunus trituberculatus]